MICDACFFENGFQPEMHQTIPAVYGCSNANSDCTFDGLRGYRSNSRSDYKPRAVKCFSRNGLNPPDERFMYIDAITNYEQGTLTYLCPKCKSSKDVRLEDPPPQP